RTPAPLPVPLPPPAPPPPRHAPLPRPRRPPLRRRRGRRRARRPAVPARPPRRRRPAPRPRRRRRPGGAHAAGARRPRGDAPLAGRHRRRHDPADARRGRRPACRDLPIPVRWRPMDVPLLFLHGSPAGSAGWDDLLARLPGIRAARPALPGFGDAPEDGGFELTSMAAWVETQRAPLGAPIDLVVHDAGAFYGLAWAIEHPDLVRRIVVTNAWFQRDYRWHFWARIWRTRCLGELSMKLFMWPTFYLEMRR